MLHKTPKVAWAIWKMSTCMSGIGLAVTAVGKYQLACTPTKGIVATFAANNILYLHLQQAMNRACYLANPDPRS